jgi:hypothetical protein
MVGRSKTPFHFRREILSDVNSPKRNRIESEISPRSFRRLRDFGVSLDQNPTLVKFSSSAAATKYSRWRNFMGFAHDSLAISAILVTHSRYTFSAFGEKKPAIGLLTYQWPGRARGLPRGLRKAHSRENRKRATGHRNPPPMTGARSSATPKLLCHRDSLPAIIRSSRMAVLDAPEVHSQKVKRGHSALNVREDPDDRWPYVQGAGT